MQVVQGDQLEWKRGLQYRGGSFHGRDVLQGTPGTTDNMDEAHFSWLPAQGEPGVSVKTLGVFTDRRTEAGKLASSVSTGALPRLCPSAASTFASRVAARSARRRFAASRPSTSPPARPRGSKLPRR